MKFLTVLLLLSTIQILGGDTINYGYDTVGRLNQVTYADGKTIHYNYDTIGNLLSRSVVVPCFDFSLLQAELPNWSQTVDIRDLVALVVCTRSTRTATNP